MENFTVVLFYLGVIWVSGLIVWNEISKGKSRTEVKKDYK